MKIPGCTRRWVDRYGAETVAAIERAEAMPETVLPVPHRPRKPRTPPAVERRMTALAAWRVEAAARTGLDAGLLLPRRLMERLAESPPGDLEALLAVDGFRRWRTQNLGPEILRVLPRG